MESVILLSHNINIFDLFIKEEHCPGTEKQEVNHPRKCRTARMQFPGKSRKPERNDLFCKAYVRKRFIELRQRSIEKKIGHIRKKDQRRLEKCLKTSCTFSGNRLPAFTGEFAYFRASFRDAVLRGARRRPQKRVAKIREAT